ncbi:MAG: S8 family serine peptidase [Candidatus Thorarchaeota archaeon]
MKIKCMCLLALFIISNIGMLFLQFNIIPFSHPNADLTLKQPHASDKSKENVIVFHNQSSYDQNAKVRFQYYGGILKDDWNNLFSRISGFAGIIPLSNLTFFRNEFPEMNIEVDEIIETQMNYASFQSGAKNSSWYINGYNGNTDSSIAILDSGVNADQIFLRNKLIGGQSFVDESPLTDEFGHGTLISSIIAGTGTDSYNSNTPSVIGLHGNYTHSDLFGYDPSPRNFTLKVCSFNTSKINSKIILNSTWNLIEPGIDKFWFELYCNNDLVNTSQNILPNQQNVINHQVSGSGLGVYDVYIKYHRQTNKFPAFLFNSNVLIFPEFYVKYNNHFSGIANSTKVLSYKVVNRTGMGYTSDLISALGSLIENRTKYHIVSTCISIGITGNDFGAINKVIDDVIDNGIVVTIAAGNLGIKGTQSTLNKLALKNNAIIVGAINDRDQVSSYSGAGKELDIVAPGGSKLRNHRTIIGADSKSNKTTSATGTSISTAIVSAATNILIEAIWGDWIEWENQNVQERVKIIKSILLMTASETNLQREDDPKTSINESQYSPTSFSGILSSLKDEHEGYGRVNIQAAIDALTKFLKVNNSIDEYLYSSSEKPFGKHAFARRVSLIPNKQYLFNLTEIDETANFDLFLFSNQSKNTGEPLILETSRMWYQNSNSLYFTPKKNQTECIIIVKASYGYGNFTLKISEVNNYYSPKLKIPEISYYGGVKNTTVMGFQEFLGSYHPKNYSIDRYRFYIDYYDNDSSNVPPQEVYVSIIELSKNFTLSQLNEMDMNYTNGALFASDYIELRKAITYHYFFIASDGSHIVRYPEVGELSISIEYPYDSEKFPYNHSFNNGLGNWIYNGTGWGLLRQKNYFDNRSGVYTNNWSSMYFGAFHTYPSNYSYQPDLLTNPYPNGTLFSPLFDLTQIDNQTTLPFARFGFRTSINSGDFIILQISLNWTNWITLRVFTNEETEWHIESFNLTDYAGFFVQFRFISLLDDNFDPVNYKGFILDYFELTNYSNSFTPRIKFDINEDISATSGSKFETFSISCNYRDRDNNYPEFVYIELDGTNYSMINLIGAWNSNHSIRFTRSLLLGKIDNRSFRFHVSDGLYINTTQWYNVNNTLFNFINPLPNQFNVLYNGKLIGYKFSNASLTDFYVTGKPDPKENTAWFRGDNTWHPIQRLGQFYLYGGIGESFGSASQGYNPNWNAKLITHPLYLRSEYDSYLQYNFEIVLQNEYGVSRENLDSCIVSISRDYGESWIVLKKYFYDSETLSGNESLDISEYANEVIMVMFSLNSNDNTIGLGYGWLLSEIYIGYDENTDFINPEIQLIKPLDQEIISSIYYLIASITDNENVDNSKIYIYIDGILIERQLYSFDRNTGILGFNWDTTYSSDGVHQITVIAFDEEGNRGEASISVLIQNGFFNWRTWGPWALIIVIIVILSFISYRIVKREVRIRKKKIRAIQKIKVDQKEVEQALKIKQIDLQKEIKIPLTLHCKYCKSWFESSKFDYICPICEHDQLYVAYNCINCNKWYFKDEPSESYYCKNKNCEGIRLVRRKSEEVKDILAKEGILLRKFDRKKRKFSILD